MTWLIARVAASHELDITDNIPGSWCPVFKRRCRPAGKRNPIDVKVAAWPGYIMVPWDIDEDSLRNSKWFYHFLSVDDARYTLTDDQIAVYKTREARGEFDPSDLPGILLMARDRVRIVEGMLFKGYRGEIEDVRGESALVGGRDFQKSIWFPVLHIVRESV